MPMSAEHYYKRGNIMSLNEDSKPIQDAGGSTPVVEGYGNTPKDNTDPVRFAKLSPNNLGVSGIIAVVGILIALLIVGYTVFYQEDKRMGAERPDVASEPVTPPDAAPVSPDPAAPSFPDKPADAAPAAP
jgi:hypothetical protein